MAMLRSAETLRNSGLLPITSYTGATILESADARYGYFAKRLRDYVILMLLYTTGIRVSELINIWVRDISLHEPCTLLVHGKGQKSRYVRTPLLFSCASRQWVCLRLYPLVCLCLTH